MSEQIYTEKFCEQEMKKLLEQLKEDKGIITLWQLFEEQEYGVQRFSEWTRLYPENKKLSDYSVTIKNIIENRKQLWALTGKLNATFTIFDLKNNHGWKDKSETELSGNVWIGWILNDLWESSSDLTQQ